MQRRRGGTHVGQVLARRGQVLDDRDAEASELRGGADARPQEQLRRADRAAAEDDLTPRAHAVFGCRRARRDDYSGRMGIFVLGLLEEHVVDVRVYRDGEVRPREDVFRQVRGGRGTACVR